MMDKLYDFLIGGVNFLPGSNEFERGFYSGLILVGLVLLLIIVLCVILKLIFRKPAVTGITLEREDGNIFISRAAISSAVVHIEDEIEGLEISKVILSRNRRREMVLALTVYFDTDGGSFDAAAGKLKARVFEVLAGTFGIDSIKAVPIYLAKTRSGISRRNVDNDDVAPMPNSFIAGV